MLQVDVQFSCSHVTTVPCESVLEKPVKGTEVRCARCKRMVRIINVGTPYRIDRPTRRPDDRQKSMLEDE